MAAEEPEGKDYCHNAEPAIGPPGPWHEGADTQTALPNVHHHRILSPPMW